MAPAVQVPKVPRPNLLVWTPLMVEQKNICRVVPEVNQMVPVVKVLKVQLSSLLACVQLSQSIEPWNVFSADQ